MAFRYTGQSDTFVFGGKRYAKPALFKKNPKLYDASYDTPIAGMTQKLATHLIEYSSLHAFEEDGEDLAEKLTTPERPLQTTTSVDAAEHREEVAKDKK